MTQPQNSSSASKMVCSFTGHREIPAKDFQRIKSFAAKTVDLLISKGVTEFIVGGATGFDMLCAEIVIEAKGYADVRLSVAVPCRGQDRYYCLKDKERYKRILECADDVVILSDRYYNGCMHVRNRYMVDKSEFVVSYCTKDTGGTYYTKNYAVEKGKFVIECSIDKFD